MRRPSVSTILTAASLAIAGGLLVAGVLTAAGVGVREDDAAGERRAATSGPRIRFEHVAGPAPAGQPITLRVDVRSATLLADAAKGDRSTTGAPRSAAVAKDTAYVLFQLDDGRYDDTAFVDTVAAERALGLDPDVHLVIDPNPDGTPPDMPQGEYSPSLDGTITYRRVPAGRHTVRAYLIRADHTDLSRAAEMEFEIG